jgi:hypothetical protein
LPCLVLSCPSFPDQKQDEDKDKDKDDKRQGRTQGRKQRQRQSQGQGQRQRQRQRQDKLKDSKITKDEPETKQREVKDKTENGFLMAYRISLAKKAVLFVFVFVFALALVFVSVFVHILSLSLSCLVFFLSVSVFQYYEALIGTLKAARKKGNILLSCHILSCFVLIGLWSLSSVFVSGLCLVWSLSLDHC